MPPDPQPTLANSGLPARALPSVRRLVVKIGSAVLAPAGVLDQAAVDALGRQLAAVRATGVLVTLVSSGAVASGFRPLGLGAPPKTIELKQAAAAVGQPRLMNAWAEAMAPHATAVAQVLYTADDLDSRARFLNARRTLNQLLAAGVLPIVNENDTVSFDEIKLGDNDRLSALTANLVSADLLLILSTAHGLYERGDPSRIIATVANTASAAANVRPEKSATGVGGMATKLEAAALATAWGLPTVVAGGSVPNVIARVLAGEPVGTIFLPPASGTRSGGARSRSSPARKRWIAAAPRSRGTITVDDGAARAIATRGASLLPSGIVAVAGRFDRGSPVEIADRKGAVLARGLSNFSAVELGAIKGLRSSQIEGALGYRYADEAVHRDDLVLLPAAPRDAGA